MSDLKNKKDYKEISSRHFGWIVRNIILVYQQIILDFKMINRILNKECSIRLLFTSHNCKTISQNLWTDEIIYYHSNQSDGSNIILLGHTYIYIYIYIYIERKRWERIGGQWDKTEIKKWWRWKEDIFRLAGWISRSREIGRKLERQVGIERYYNCESLKLFMEV